MSGLTLLCQECSQSSWFFATYTNSPNLSQALRDKKYLETTDGVEGISQSSNEVLLQK